MRSFTNSKCLKSRCNGHDPLLDDGVIRGFGSIPWTSEDITFDGVIIAAGHRQFREMAIEEIRSLMTDNPVLIDVKGIVDKTRAQEMGMYYQKL